MASPLVDLTTTAPSGNPLDDKKYAGQPAAPVSEDQQRTAEQQKYQTFLETRLTRAQTTRDRVWPEFNNKTYLQQFEENEKISNTYLEPKKNEDDVILSSGTIEAKLNTLLSNVDSLNISPEVLAFNHSSVPLQDLGRAITDIMDRCAENDGGTDGGDDEKRILRQKELLKQGTVFVQDRWACKYAARKKIKGTYSGQFDWSDWDTKLEKVFEGCERTLLYGPNVYLGDVTMFSMDDQPYAFTIEQVHYDMAKGQYSQFDNWKYVKPGMIPARAQLAENGVGGRTIYDGKFRMTSLKDDQVEIIKYQDQTRDEFQIIINGIMLLPIGFPLSAISAGGKYNISKQILYPINPQFAYGKSFVASGDVYELSKIVDEMLRLFVLKTRKSVTPAYLNTSGRVISKRVLSPGNISMGVPAGALQPVGTESQGVTSGEFQVYQELIERIEQSTVSPVFQGQYGKANTTATEVMQVQDQAKKSLGIIVAACTMMEVKLGYLRLPIILSKWFEPVGTIKNGDVYNSMYRSSSTEAPILNDGVGVRRVVPVEGQLPDADAVRVIELAYEKETGTPMELIFISASELQKQKMTWRIVAAPKQKESSAYDKVLFSEMMQGILGLINVGARPNVTGLETEFAKTFGVDRNKIFANQADMANQAQDLRAPAARTAGNMAAGNMPNSPGAPTAAPGMTQQVGAAP